MNIFIDFLNSIFFTTTNEMDDNQVIDDLPIHLRVIKVQGLTKDNIESEFDSYVGKEEG